MASTISSLQSICRTNFHAISTNPSSLLTFPIGNISVRRYDVVRNARNLLLVKKNKCREMILRVRVVDEETTVELVTEGDVEAVASEQPVLVSVSPSDLLTMFFQAEGIMSEAAIPSVRKALESTELYKLYIEELKNARIPYKGCLELLLLLLESSTSVPSEYEQYKVQYI